MRALSFLKRSMLSLVVMALSTSGCSGDPSVSVLPSEAEFTQEGNEITAKMDILWVIDNSGSMQPYQDDLAANFTEFITEFVGKGYDFRMAVTATDGHYTDGPTYADEFWLNCGKSDLPFTSKFVDRNPFDTVGSGYRVIKSDDTSIDFSLTPPGQDADETDDIEYIFGYNIDQGDCGSGDEGGLESLRDALNNPFNQSLAEIPEGFPRPDAHLAIIVITDEQDDDGTGNNIPVAEYDTFLRGITNNDLGYSFHTIGVLPGQLGNYIDNAPLGNQNTGGSEDRYECLTNGVDNGFRLFATASEGSRYTALSDLSNGIKASICAPFADSLQKIAQSIIETTVEFKLDKTPKFSDGAGIVVSVKNVGETEFSTVPRAAIDGWSYNASRNSIIFNGTAIPAQGAQIKAFYDPDSL